jgi:hypothetical protein
VQQQHQQLWLKDMDFSHEDLQLLHHQNMHNARDLLIQSPIDLVERLNIPLSQAHRILQHTAMQVAPPYVTVSGKPGCRRNPAHQPLSFALVSPACQISATPETLLLLQHKAASTPTKLYSSWVLDVAAATWRLILLRDSPCLSCQADVLPSVPSCCAGDGAPQHTSHALRQATHWATGEWHPLETFAAYIIWHLWSARYAYLLAGALLGTQQLARG